MYTVCGEVSQQGWQAPEDQQEYFSSDAHAVTLHVQGLPTAQISPVGEFGRHRQRNVHVCASVLVYECV